MDKAFKQVEPLILQEIHGHVCLDGDSWIYLSYAKDLGPAGLSYDDAIALRNWLDAATWGEGWKLVPVEPTVEMKIAGGRAFYEGRVVGDAQQCVIYRAMLSAAPQVGD